MFKNVIFSVVFVEVTRGSEGGSNLHPNWLSRPLVGFVQNWWNVLRWSQGRYAQTVTITMPWQWWHYL